MNGLKKIKRGENLYKSGCLHEYGKRWNLPFGKFWKAGTVNTVFAFSKKDVKIKVQIAITKNENKFWLWYNLFK